MSKSMMKWTLGLLAVGCMLTLAGPAAAEWTMMDSEDFAWQYEMDVDPGTQDLDGNGNRDFRPMSSGGSSSFDAGILTLNCSNSKYNIYRSGLDGDSGKLLWQAENFTAADGYTLEMRMKVNSSTGAHGAISIIGNAVDCDWHFRLLIHGNKTERGSYGLGYYEDLDNNDNTDAFHVFRLAQKAGEEVFRVWRDGVFLAELTDTGSYTEKMVQFGDQGGDWGGEVEIDYFRFTKRAYAPIPEPSTLMLLAGAALALLVWRRR
jgi:hypothetical protein